MLVLTRRPSEVIKIGPDIYVVVVDCRGSKVRLGVVAPPTTPVNRIEILPPDEVRDAPVLRITPPANVTAPRTPRPAPNRETAPAADGRPRRPKT